MKSTLFLTILALVACTYGQSSEDTSQNAISMQTTPTSGTADQQAVQALAETLFRETDNRRWEAVKGTMANSVYTDYTALGGEAGFKTPNEIVGGWQQLLPGFERTVHQPHHFAVWVADDRATATLDAIATHYLNGDHWKPTWITYSPRWTNG